MFFAASGPNGRELYRLTPGGAVSLLADVIPGARSSDVKGLFVDGNNLYFQARSAEDNFFETYSLSLILTSTEEPIVAVPAKLYPNPSAGLLAVEAPAGHRIEAVEVYSQLGRMVLQQPFSGLERARLDLGELAAGQYWVRLRYTEGVSNVSGVVVGR